MRSHIPNERGMNMSEEVKVEGELKVINESTDPSITPEEVAKIQGVVDKAFNPKPLKGNPIAENLLLEDGEMDCRQLSDADMKQVIIRLNKNVADGFNVLIDELNYITLVLLESLAPSKKAEVMKRIDAIKVRGEQEVQ